MKTIGLVGGVASGKSTVARMLVELGVGLLDADRTGHDVLADDAEVSRALRCEWGDSVFTSDGSVDRTAVAGMVFSGGDTAEENRRFLEDLLHRRIRRRLEKLRQQFADEGYHAVVLDAPLLLEAGWGPMCDLVVMVDSPRELRLARARGRGWSDEDFTRREAAQWLVEDKRRGSSLLIENDGSEEQLRSSVKGLWRNHIGQPAPND
jgi:dephospho-CoA kinase